MTDIHVRRSRIPDTDSPTRSDIIDIPGIGEDVVQAKGIDAKRDDHDEYLDELKFNEDPITVMIHPSYEENPEPSIFCSVQGRRAEMLVDGKFIQVGYLPVGVELTTRRKYIEGLFRARTVGVDSHHDPVGSQFIRNWITRTDRPRVMVQIINDPSPKSAEWVRRVTSDR